MQANPLGGWTTPKPHKWADFSPSECGSESGVEGRPGHKPEPPRSDEEALRGSWNGEAARTAVAKLSLIIAEEVGRAYWNDLCFEREHHFLLELELKLAKVKAADSCDAKGGGGVVPPPTAQRGRGQRAKRGNGPKRPRFKC